MQTVADAYLSFIKLMSENKSQRVTDKLLTNYYFAGFINILYPKAKIIHTMRNPVDTCWSSFTKLYKDDMPHSYDLRELGRYYRKYMDIMEYWRQVLPKGLCSTFNTRTWWPTAKPKRVRSSNSSACRGTKSAWISTARNVPLKPPAWRRSESRSTAAR